MNLIEFRKYKAWNAHRDSLEDPTYWPCLYDECGGSGWIYDPSEQSCPVEGNKMRSKIRCPMCGGTGRSDYQAFAEQYVWYTLQEGKARKQQENELKMLNAALDKLTSEEIRLLKKYRFTNITNLIY